MKQSAAHIALAAALTAGLTLAPRAQAQFLLTEYFGGHKAGAAVENAANPTAPAAGEWTQVDGTTDSESPVIADGALIYSGYSASGQGHSMRFTAPAAYPCPQRTTALCLTTQALPYPCQPQEGFIEGSNVFYTAFLLDLKGSTGEETQEIFSWCQAATGGRRGCLLYRLSSDKKSVRFCLVKRNEANLPALIWTPYCLLSPLLIVVKYIHVCLDERNFGHASFKLFVNPDPSRSEEANAAAGLDAYGNDYGYDTDLRAIAFRQDGQTNMRISGIRIANTFEEALTGTETGSGIHTPIKPSVFSVYGKNIIPPVGARGQVSLYGINGALLRVYDIGDATPVNTALETGLYLLKYRSQEQEYTQKILIQ